MKYVIVALAALSLAACGKASRYEAAYTGYSKICVDHVQYIQFTSGAAVQVDPTGKPVGC